MTLQSDKSKLKLVPPLLICGPMFSGKTSELLRVAKRYSLRGEMVILVKHSQDQRDHDRNGLITSRDGMQSPLNRVVDRLNVDDLVGDNDAPCIIGVDEGQFFPDLIEFCDEAERRGHRVIVAALNADFRREPFPCIVRLMARAEIRQLSAVCFRCGADALHTAKIGGDQMQIIEVGDTTTYQAVCTNCYCS